MDQRLPSRDSDESSHVNDNWRTLPTVNFHFWGELRNYQKEACRNAYSKDMGVLCAPTGSDKTVMGLALIANRQQPALIVVHTKELLYQWANLKEIV